MTPKRLDTELFKQHIELLSRCQPIDVPAFDFTIQDRKPGFRLEYKPGDIVIMEGIHALNPDVIGLRRVSPTACTFQSDAP